MFTACLTAVCQPPARVRRQWRSRQVEYQERNTGSIPQLADATVGSRPKLQGIRPNILMDTEKNKNAQDRAEGPRKFAEPADVEPMGLLMIVHPEFIPSIPELDAG